MTPQPDILAVTTLNKYLYVVTRAGHLLPVYRYGPLTPTTTEDVPWAESWPGYNRSAVDAYVPVPAVDPASTPDHLEADFVTQPRPGSSQSPWPQAVYRGWPLYLLGDGTAPCDDPATIHDAPGALFRMVRVEIEQGPITGQPGMEAPTRSSGTGTLTTLSVTDAEPPSLPAGSLSSGPDDEEPRIQGVPGFCGP